MSSSSSGSGASSCFADHAARPESDEPPLAAVPATRLPDGDNDDGDDGDTTDDDDDDDDECGGIFASIRSRTGLEIGVAVTWPLADDHDGDDDGDDRSDSDGDRAAPTTRLRLSTCLPPSALAPMFDGTQWAGTTVWRAAVVALRYLLRVRTNQKKSQQQQQQEGGGAPLLLPGSGGCLLELGCGLGVPGMVWHGVTRDRVILTDRDVLVPQLRANLDANFGSDSASSSGRRGGTGASIEAHPLDWSAAGVRELLRACTASDTSNSNSKINSSGSGNGDGGTRSGNDEHGENDDHSAAPTPTTPFSIDIILNCDCIYEPLYGDSWKQLLECQRELLRRWPRAYCLTSVERRRDDGVDRYLQAAAATCDDGIGRVERLRAPFPHARSVELYRLHGRNTIANSALAISHS